MAVGRFQVMALMQAARAYALGLPLESAYSWGLNRAIFIAAAKRGFKGGGGGGMGEGKRGKTSRASAVYYLGDDMAYKTLKGGVLRFTIGGEMQTKEDFDRQVKSRFGKAFGSAWKEALSYVKSFDKDTLLSANGFFTEVYKRRRDELAEKWTEASEASE
ncbi:MAG TPA: hypothetical protein VEC92_01190 [Nitrososphaerales archaeon]|nr:hypothetical protein [Nitrososphaerales archaeon]